MAAGQDDSDSAPTVRFKRRKITHPRRVQLEQDQDQSQDQELPEGAEDSTPALREILRNRRRPQDRTRRIAQNEAEQRLDALITLETQRSDQYAGRFIAQTGQVVEQDDKQMMEFVEARLAEHNRRQYGWPVPKHLEQAAVGSRADAQEIGTNTGQSRQEGRLAAGMGKLQEIDLGPEATERNIQRTEEARRRAEGHVPPAGEETQDKGRSGKAGKPRRRQKRRNSEDLRRDMMVEAVLREAKIDYFEEDKPASSPTNSDQDADDALAEQFRRDFLESIESQRQRKPAQPPGVKGAKEQPKGPKLGGSRSARAAMRLQEEQAAKSKR